MCQHAQAQKKAVLFNTAFFMVLMGSQGNQAGYAGFWKLPRQMKINYVSR